MTNTLLSYCKLSGGSRLLEFGETKEHFNYVSGEGIFRAKISRQLTDSIEISIEKKDKNLSLIDELKITNQSLLTWDDYWITSEGNVIIDPRIKNLNLQRNHLVYVNMNTPRLELISLNLEGNQNLQHLYLHEVPKLKRLDITGCTGLKYISMGINGAIQEIIAKDCNMSPSAMEQLLRDFTPIVTANANLRGAGAFRKQHSTVVDFRGNTIDWSNRKIASKIRLLLLNNWVVKWDNNPPYNIIPPQMYGVFVESQIAL